MSEINLVLILVGVLAFSLISGKLNNTIVTMPLVFIGFGFALGPGGLSVVDLSPQDGLIDLLFEITLVVILFSDASRINLRTLIKDHNLPQRLLLVGMPITILLGAVTASFIFESFTIWEAALLAAILAPTDAALGQSGRFQSGGASSHPSITQCRERP